jgi:proline iminopeptidase
MKNIITFLFLLTGPALFAQRTDSVRNGNTQIYYELKGKGMPIYILPGGPGLTPHYLSPVMDELSKFNLCVLIHQRGTGLTRFTPGSKMSYIDEFCKDIDQVRKKLGHERIILLGHSWGGMLAMQMAVSYPKTIHKLILISSGGYNLDFLSYFKDNIYSALSLEDQQLIAGQGKLITGNTAGGKKLTAAEMLQIMSRGYVYDKTTAQQIKLGAKDINSFSGDEVWKSLAAVHWDLGEKLRVITCRTLILQGRQDPIDLQTAGMIRTHIKGSRLQVIEQCGHFPWLEQPEIFYGSISSFLKVQ